MNWRRRSSAFESEGQLDRVKLIYTIPEHANPTGISLAAERRQSAGRSGTQVVQDAAHLRAGGCSLSGFVVRGA